LSIDYNNHGTKFETTEIGIITMLGKTVNFEHACILGRSGGEIKGYSYL